MPRARNPFAYVIWAYHEAGHAVVAHALGLTVRRLCVTHDGGLVECDPVVIDPPITAPNNTERERGIAVVRKRMVVDAAGNEAAVIHWRQVEKRGYASRREIRGYTTYGQHPLSFHFGVGNEGGLDSDLFFVVHEARAICWATFIAEVQRIMQRNSDDRTELIADARRRFDENRKEKELIEISRAEKTADGLLNKYWDAVEDVVAVVLGKNSRHITGEELRQLIGHHFDPASEAFAVGA